MSFLRPNIPAVLTPKTGTDKFGQPTLGDPVSIVVAVVNAKRKTQHTTVRADASATRAYADEFATDNRILIPPTISVKMGDKLEVSGLALRITSIHPRYSVWGPLDHYEVEGAIWA